MFKITCSCGESVVIGGQAQKVENAFGEITEGSEVPKEYWDLKKKNDLKGSRYEGWWTTKVGNDWIFKRPNT